MIHLTSVRLRRLDLGLTRAELAERAGLTVPRLASIEEGKAPLTTDELIALSGALRVDAAALADQDRLTVDVIPPRLKDRPTVVGRRAERCEGDLRRSAR